VALRGLVGACAVLIAALAATGCGSGGLTPGGDAALGKELFTGEGQCGSCHTLADAGTKGVIGPNLDDAFRQSREDGLGDRTIQSVVRDQIAYPVEHPTTGAPGMPADIVTGEDADSVAFYVASVAALPVRPQPGAQAGGAGGDTGGETGGETGGSGEGAAPDGKAIFAEAGCGSCHTLKAAGASGTVGPNLDEAKPPKELVIDRVTNGKGVMPSFKDSYSAEQIAAVADYVSKNAGQ
jgi:mono/diheme cytochrome c family protein